jgi:hypothetical protein
MKYDVIVDLENKTNRGFKQIEKNLESLDRKASSANSSFKKLGGPLATAAKGVAAFGAAIAAAGAALGVLIIKNSAVITQMNNQARLAGISTTEFQKLSFAAMTVGVEGDKLSDIFKDVNDKFGDFAATGGGPLKDFFENIAPLVGITADQFKNLSGPQALQLYVDGLEKANLSQADMTFYMEAIASDATTLIPLLRNGGEAFAVLGAQAEAAGLILDNVGVRKVANANKSFDQLKRTMSAVGDQMTAGLAPGLQAVSDMFAEWIQIYLPGIQETAATVFPYIVTAVGVVIDVVTVLGDVFQTLDGIMIIVGNSIVLAFAGVGKAIEATINTLIKGINTFKTAINDLTNFSISNPITGETLFGLEGTNFEMSDELQMVGTMYDDAAAAITRGKQKILDASASTISVMSGEGPGATLANSINKQTEALTAQAENASLANDVMEALGKSTENTAIATDSLSDSTTDLSDNITNRATPALKGLPKTIDEAEKKMDSLKNSLKGVGDTLTKDLATALRTGQGLWESFGNFFGSLLDMILQKILEIVIVKPLMDSLFGEMGGFGGTGGGLFGSILGGIFGARAAGGPTAAGRPYLVGEQGPELFVPGGSGSIVPSSDTMSMISGGGGGQVYAPVFNTTIQTSGNSNDPEQAKKLATEFNKAIEAKVAATVSKMQNGNRGLIAAGRNY